MTDLARTQTDAAGAHQRRTPALVGAVWALLVINTLGSQGAVTVIPIPRPVRDLAVPPRGTALAKEASIHACPSIG